ncbi:MAG: hypothetical protein H8Z69_03235 [Nanohaloarchaea archaeon]|nr:hypothetical protein [Candidatus Nanohaloarchaea archaeon]
MDENDYEAVSELRRQLVQGGGDEDLLEKVNEIAVDVRRYLSNEDGDPSLGEALSVE